MPPRRQKPASPRRIIAFLDTNIFLHFLPFDQIPWLKELKADSVELRVPREVIGELAKHKDGHAIGHVKERAGKILKRILKFALADEGRVGDSGAITITCEQQPAGFDLQARGFDPAIADDRILAAVLDFKEQHPGEHVVLVTEDAGAALRAHSYGVLVLGLSDGMGIMPTPDEKQKRIRELEARLNEMQKGLPRLGLSFPGGATDLEFTVEPDTAVTDVQAHAYADGEVVKLSPQQTGAALQRMANKAYRTPLDDEVFASVVKTLSAAAGIMAINARHKLVLFHTNCVAYFAAFWKYTNEMRRTKEIRLVLENTGTLPAEDIYLRLRLPGSDSLLH
jgi:rRNA-processing protein FCF1